MAFYRFWAIILPIVGGSGITGEWLSLCTLVDVAMRFRIL